MSFVLQAENFCRYEASLLLSEVKTLNTSICIMEQLENSRVVHPCSGALEAGRGQVTQRSSATDPGDGKETTRIGIG